MSELSHLVSVLPIIIDEVPYEGSDVWVEGLALPLDHVSRPSAHLHLCCTLAVFRIYPDKESGNTNIETQSLHPSMSLDHTTDSTHSTV